MSSRNGELLVHLVAHDQSLVELGELGALRMKNHNLMMEMSELRRELNRHINKAVRDKQKEKDICWVPEATLKELRVQFNDEQKMRRRLCGEGLEDCTEDELLELRKKMEQGLERVGLAIERSAAEARVLARYPEYKCPLSLGLMRDPVVTSDGQSYERTEIEKWFRQCRDKKEPLKSPLRAPLASDKLVSNNNLRRAIEDAVDLEVGLFEVAVQLKLDGARAAGAAKRARSKN